MMVFIHPQILQITQIKKKSKKPAFLPDFIAPRIQAVVNKL